MKNPIPFLIFVLLLTGCSNTIKTYHSNGTIESEYIQDQDKRKNGLYKIYDMDGRLDAEMEMIHDTMSGSAKFYNPTSGKISMLFSFKRGIYNIPFTDSDFVFKMNSQSFVELKRYNEIGIMSAYSYATVMNNDHNFGLGVEYKDDSILRINGTPIPIVDYYDTGEVVKSVKLALRNIPKCSTNFYVLDSADNVVCSCIGCKRSDKVKLDYSKSYTLKVELIDSVFGIKHTITEPFCN